MLDKGVAPTSVGVRSVAVGFMCLLCDCLEHDEVCLPKGFLTGFNVTWILEDSHVLRPQPPISNSAAF